MSALLLFACMDTTTKLLSTRYNVPRVVAIRYIVHCLLMITLLAPSQDKRLVQTQRTGLILICAASLAMLPKHFRQHPTAIFHWRKDHDNERTGLRNPLAHG